MTATYWTLEILDADNTLLDKWVYETKREAVQRIPNAFTTYRDTATVRVVKVGSAVEVA